MSLKISYVLHTLLQYLYVLTFYVRVAQIKYAVNEHFYMHLSCMNSIIIDNTTMCSMKVGGFQRSELRLGTFHTEIEKYDKPFILFLFSKKLKVNKAF